MSTELGDRLRTLREQKGWTQDEVGALVHTTGRTVGNWERGESEPRNKLGMLEELFGVDLRTGNATGDQVIAAIERSDLTVGNQHRLIAEYVDMLASQEGRRSG